MKLMSLEAPSPASRYGLAIVSTALALLLTLALAPFLGESIFAIFLAAVMVSAWHGGLGPGLVAAGLSAFASLYALLPPRFELLLSIEISVRLAAFLGTAVLISALTEARRRSERAAYDAQERYAVTLDSIGDAVIVTDREGHITLMNPVAQELTGWPLADGRGRPIGEVFRIINETTRRPVESPVERALREGRVVGLANHTLLVARDGAERPIDDSGAPVRARDGGVVGAVLVFRDVSARRAEERARDEALRREQASRDMAEAAIGVRDRFLALAAHELRTPLTATLGNLQLARRRLAEGTGAEQRLQRSLQLADEQLHRLDEMISTLLDVSRLEGGQLSLARTRVELCALVRRVVEQLEATLTRHTVTCETLEPELPLSGDPVRLEQVIANLLQNAVKYSPDGGAVTVRVGRQGERGFIAVADRGVGIPAEALARLFERFYRAPDSAGRGIRGMGIGLYVVREIVALHGGTVEVESVEGEGSTFTVWLPLTLPTASAVPSADMRAG